MNALLNQFNFFCRPSYIDSVIILGFLLRPSIGLQIACPTCTSRWDRRPLGSLFHSHWWDGPRPGRRPTWGGGHHNNMGIKLKVYESIYWRDMFQFHSGTLGRVSGVESLIPTFWVKLAPPPPLGGHVSRMYSWQASIPPVPFTFPPGRAPGSQGPLHHVQLIHPNWIALKCPT